jgi:hypothetical protein
VKPVAEQWFYNRGGVKSGPVSLGDLRRLAASGGLSPQDLIWKEGMFAWVAAGTMKGLFAASGQTAAAPVTPGSAPTRPAAESPACSIDGRGGMADRRDAQTPALRPAPVTTAPALFHRSGEAKPTTIAAESGSETKQPMKPFWVGLALFLFFPLGFLLLAIHPQLRTKKAWWAVGAAWALLLMMAPRQSDDTPPPPPPPAVPEEDPPKPPREPASGLATPGVGDFFTLGEFKYRITAVNTTRRIGKTLFGEFAGEEASSRAVFVIVSYTIENMGTESQTVLSDDFKIEDGRGRTFKPSSAANVALLMESDDKDFLLSELQPGLPRSMKQAFELPEQAIDSPITIIVPEKGFWVSGSVRVPVSVR